MNLPLELVDLVLESLAIGGNVQDLTGLRTSALVSRSWYEMARRHIFSDVTLDLGAPARVEAASGILTQSPPNSQLRPIIHLVVVLKLCFPTKQVAAGSLMDHVDALHDFLEQFNHLPSESSLQTLEIKGPSNGLSWDYIPLRLRNVIADLVKRPSIAALEVKRITSLPARLLLSPHLRRLRLKTVSAVASNTQCSEGAQASRISKLETLAAVDSQLEIEDEHTHGEPQLEARRTPATMDVLLRFLSEPQELRSLAIAVPSISEIDQLRQCLTAAKGLVHLNVLHSRTAHRYCQLFPLDVAPPSLRKLTLSTTATRPLVFRKPDRHLPAVFAYIQPHGYTFRSSEYPGTPASQPHKIETLIDFTRLHIPPTVTHIIVRRAISIRISYGALPVSTPLVLHLPGTGLNAPDSQFLRDCDYWESMAYQMHRLSVVSGVAVRLDMSVVLRYLPRAAGHSGVPLAEDLQWNRRNEILQDLRRALEKEGQATPGAQGSNVEIDLHVKHQFVNWN